MNKKGFTIIELLATIILLAVITSIAYVTVINVQESAKIKNEEVFIGRISDAIGDYIALYNSNHTYTYYKDYSKDTNDVTIYKTEQPIELQKLVDNKITTSPITNPRNKKDCLADNPNFYIYKDTDYVFCFSMELPCLETTNKLITNCQFEVN